MLWRDKIFSQFILLVGPIDTTIEQHVDDLAIRVKQMVLVD